MLFKKADDKIQDIQVLEKLLQHPKATPDKQKLIEREIRNIRSGLRGESETAYELEFNLKNRNWLIIHDLRIEHEGRVAQIDHLLVNRFLMVYVCESKRFSEGVAINEQGEFAAFYGSRPYGIPSPIEQNRRHLRVLEDLFSADVIQLPRRLGFTLKPELSSYILVSKAARISRPKTPVAGLDSVLKTDQFISRIERELSQENVLLMATKVIGEATLEDFGKQLVALHKPIQFDWAAKFGLTETGRVPAPLNVSVPEDLASAPETTSPAIEEPNTATVPAAEPLPTDAAAPAKSKLVCVACSASVSYNVARYCWANRKFHGKVYCMGCQATLR